MAKLTAEQRDRILSMLQTDATDDAPNYRKTKGMKNCATCSMVKGDDKSMECTAYDFSVTGGYTCDDWESSKQDSEDEEHTDAFPRVLRKMKIGPHVIAITHDPNEMRVAGGVPMRSHYGYLEKSWGYGDDGKALDCYVKPGYLPAGDEMPPVYRMVQTDPIGNWDESKFFIGFATPEEARDEHVYHVGMERSGYVEPWEWESFNEIYESEDPDEIEDDEEDEEYSESLSLDALLGADD